MCVGSDWVKGPEKKSTSGSTMIVNGTVMKHCSRTRTSDVQPVSRCLDTGEMQSVAWYLACALLAFDIGLRLFLSLDQK